MKTPSLLILPILVSLLLLGTGSLAAEENPYAATKTATGTTDGAEYKVISDFKQPFNDALQFHLSKGWKPVGGVSVTSWNNDLYFAQLLTRRSKQ